MDQSAQDDLMVELPSLRLLVSGMIRVALTLVAIVLIGILFDILLGLPIWLGALVQLLGIVPLFMGLLLEGLGTHAFWKYGSGTPHPQGHPERLVTVGPYSWSRHPLYLARHLMLLGAAWIFWSPSILVLTVLLFIVVERIMIPREEARLASRFGAPYEEYRRRVPRWFPLRRRERG